MRWAKIGQKELAEKVGVARQSINTIVNGKAIPNSILLRKIAMALNCTVDDLYYNDYE